VIALRQPQLGLAGLVLVVPIAAVLALGAGGVERSVLVLGPVVAFALAPVAMVGFWWDNWPGTALRQRAWSGWVDTAFVAAMAVLSTLAAQAIVGRLDPGALFQVEPGAGHTPTYPAVLPLAATAFAAMIQLTLVNERWPLRRLPPIPAGLAALALSWAAAILVYLFAVRVKPPPGLAVTARSGPIAAEELGALLTVISAAQVAFYLVWRGWPFVRIQPRWLRLTTANVVTIGVGLLGYVVARNTGSVEPAQIEAVAGTVVAAGIVVGVLLEGSVRPHVSAATDRVLSVAAVALLAAGLYLAASAYARGRAWVHVTPEQVITHLTLSALSVSVILHVAIGRRWPFTSARS
jgi:uncharacterized protein with FMN-binding domain